MKILYEMLVINLLYSFYFSTTSVVEFVGCGTVFSELCSVSVVDMYGHVSLCNTCKTLLRVLYRMLFEFIVNFNKNPVSAAATPEN